MKKFLVLLFILLILGVGLSLVFWPGNENNWIELDIKQGATAHQVAEQLKSAHAIQTPYLFLIWTHLRSAGNLIHIGRYRISEGRSAYWLVDDLIRGRTEKTKFVIPEGFASWQISERLEEMKLCSAEEFKQAVAKTKSEGFLFPATYNLDYGQTADDLLHHFHSQFEKMWAADIDARCKELGWTQLKAVTLASILEREIRIRSELPMVSAVYNNRLNRHMRLEADPTVQYALGYWKTRLTYKEYKNVMSPYNTYLHEGLPPGPICNPGIDAIRAALWPAASDAIFLLAQEDGHHTFSSNYRDHTNKVNRRNRQIHKGKSR